MISIRAEIPEEPTKVEPIIIVPISDTHFGTIAHDKDTWNRVKTYIKENDRCYWIGLGDYADFIPPKDKRYDARILDSKLRERSGDILTASIEYIIEEFYPIKDKCLAIGSGNHEHKYRKLVGVDIVKLIAEALGVQQNTFPYEMLLKIFFGPKSRYSLKIYASHGWGGGLLKGAKINRIAHAARTFDADIFIAGHSHDMCAAPDIIIRTNSKGTAAMEHVRWLLRVGGFRKSRSVETDYEEMSGYPPNVTGTFAIEVYRGTTNLYTTVKFLV